MAAFAFVDTPVTVTDEIAGSQREAWELLAAPGTWWSASERLAIADRCRRAFSQRSSPPWSRELPDEEPGLTAEAVRIVDRVTLDAGRIDSGVGGRSHRRSR